MGNLICIARVVELRNDLAQLDRIAAMTIRMTFSKDSVIKESGVRQCSIVQHQILRTAQQLRTINESAYRAQKSSIEKTLKQLKGCISKTVDHSKDYVNYDSTKSA